MSVSEVCCRITIFGPDGLALHSWTLRACGAPDMRLVDRLARLHLEVGRRGGRIAMSEVSAGLAELLDLAGLSELFSSEN